MKRRPFMKLTLPHPPTSHDVALLLTPIPVRTAADQEQRGILLCNFLRIIL